MTHPDARAALEKLPDASDHFKTWRNKLISLEKAEYEAARQALTQMIDGGWNSDMDAAPRDGTHILVAIASDEFQPVTAWWKYNEWCVFENKGVHILDRKPTHWKLVIPPQESGHE